MELTESQAEELANILLEEFNRQNNTNFEWRGSKSFPVEEPYDFKIFDGDVDLGVQHTRAVRDQEKEYIRPTRANLIIDNLLKRLNNLKGLFIYINFYNFPKDKEGVDRLAFFLYELLSHKKSDSRGKTYYFRYNYRDEVFLKDITPFVSDLEFFPTAPDKKSQIMWGCSTKEVKPLKDDEQAITEAVIKKENQYPKRVKEKIILLVDYEKFPFSDFYIQPIKTAMKGKLFREIWIVNNFATGQRAVRVK